MALHRRTFLQLSAASGVALATSRLRAASLNEKLNVGFIGCGGRAQELLKNFGALKDVRIVALCDPDAERLQQTAKAHHGAATYADLRKMLDDPQNDQIDAVVIATCNHWHALAAIWACERGKDVYVEKPLSHNHWEGQQVVRAARKYDRIVQIGTQQRSDPLQAKLKKFLHEDQALGPVRYVQVCRIGTREPIGKRTSPLVPPKSVDYNLWLGPAQDRPTYRDKLHYDWHWDWNTGNGEMGNWGVHVLDDALNVVLQDRVPFPKRVAAAGGRVAWNDAGETPNVGFAYYETGDEPLLFALSNLPDKSAEKRGLKIDGMATGYVIHCEGGYYAGGRGNGAAYDKNGKVIRRFRGDSGAQHARNFVDAVHAHDRKQLNAEVEIGHRSTAWCNLADIAIRVGNPYDHAAAASAGKSAESWGSVVEAMEKHLNENGVKPQTLTLSPMLEFDAATEEFTGDQADHANSLLRREYRTEFKVPTIA